MLRCQVSQVCDFGFKGCHWFIIEQNLEERIMVSLMLLSLMFLSLSVIHHCDCLPTQYVSDYLKSKVWEFPESPISSFPAEIPGRPELYRKLIFFTYFAAYHKNLKIDPNYQWQKCSAGIAR